MNLKGLVAISGRPGLFKLVGQNKSGFILESLDEQKLKLVANLSTVKLASLEDITVFGEEDELKLSDILETMRIHETAPPDPKSDGKTLQTYFSNVAPGYDTDRVYVSDIKKIISWFNIIKNFPFFTEEPASGETEETHVADLSPKKPEPVASEKVKPVTKPNVKGAVRLSQKSK